MKRYVGELFSLEVGRADDGFWILWSSKHFREYLIRVPTHEIDCESLSAVRRKMHEVLDKVVAEIKRKGEWEPSE